MTRKQDYQHSGMRLSWFQSRQPSRYLSITAAGRQDWPGDGDCAPVAGRVDLSSSSAGGRCRSRSLHRSGTRAVTRPPPLYITLDIATLGQFSRSIHTTLVETDTMLDMYHLGLPWSPLNRKQGREFSIKIILSGNLGSCNVLDMDTKICYVLYK